LRRSVVASDLDTRWVGELSRPNLEVRVHDLLEDDLTAFAVFGMLVCSSLSGCT
jgi:hypothetical protein